MAPSRASPALIACDACVGAPSAPAAANNSPPPPRHFALELLALGGSSMGTPMRSIGADPHDATGETTIGPGWPLGL